MTPVDGDVSDGVLSSQVHQPVGRRHVWVRVHAVPQRRVVGVARPAERGPGDPVHRVGGAGRPVPGAHVGALVQSHVHWKRPGR